MKKPTTPRLTFSEFIANCPYCGQKATMARDCWSISIRKSNHMLSFRMYDKE